MLDEEPDQGTELEEEIKKKLERVLYVPEGADVPSFDEYSPLTRAVLRRERYEYNYRRQVFLDAIGPETIAALQKMPPRVAKKALRGVYQIHVGNWNFTFKLCVFVCAALEKQPSKILYKHAVALLGPLSHTPEINRANRKDRDDITSAAWEAINLCIDGSWQLLEPTSLKPRLSDEEYCRRLGLSGIHHIEFRRHVRNILRARRRKNETDVEVSNVRERDFEPHLYGRARRRRPKGAKPPDGDPFDDEPHDGFRWEDPDQETRLGTKPGSLVEITSLLGRPDLPEEEPFYDEQELRRLERRLPPAHPYRNFYTENRLRSLAEDKPPPHPYLHFYTQNAVRNGANVRWPLLHPYISFYTRKHLRSLAEATAPLSPYMNFYTEEELRRLPRVRWPLLHPVTNFYTTIFYTEEELRSLPEVADPLLPPVTNFENKALKARGWRIGVHYTRKPDDPEVSAEEAPVSVRTKGLLDAEDLLAAVIAEEKKTGHREADVKKIKGVRQDVIHGELVVVKIGEPQTKMAGVKAGPPLTVDITSASPAIIGDVPDSIRRTEETVELDLDRERESQEREKELRGAIEILCQARSAQDKKRRRRVIEYAIENDVSFRKAAHALGEPERVADEINRRARRLRKRGQEALKELLSKSASNPAT